MHYNLNKEGEEKAEDVLSSYGNLHQAILDAMHAHIAVIDKNGVIVAVNAAWETFLQENSGETVQKSPGQNYLAVCYRASGSSAHIAQSAAEGIRSVLEGTQAQFTYEYPCHSPEKQRWFLMQVTPLSLLAGAVIAHIDITERRLAEDTIRELEQRQGIFINTANHELKTPLTALKGLVHLCKRMLAKQKDPLPYLDRIEAQITSLTGIVNGLLDMTKIQSGQVDFVDEPFDLTLHLHDVIDTLQRIYPDHTLYLHGEFQQSVVGDKEKFRTVFLNLIENAIKYSPDVDKVDIFLSKTDTHLIVSVQDYGIGVPEEYQQEIFKRFYRAKQAKGRFIPGTGLGLYISYEIIKHYGGDLTVKSEEGKGSRFSIALPI